ncbi:hypothetical protein V1514DRAFT_331880 [Lipomyces japonicus]|uniref:uncharacterized protein n=1 Tax=Lipomyces japonicus TaxID=56871 RepID=UPI0034CD482F
MAYFPPYGTGPPNPQYQSLAPYLMSDPVFLASDDQFAVVDLNTGVVDQPIDQDSNKSMLYLSTVSGPIPYGGTGSENQGDEDDVDNGQGSHLVTSSAAGSVGITATAPATGLYGHQEPQNVLVGNDGFLLSQSRIEDDNDDPHNHTMIRNGQAGTSSATPAVSAAAASHGELASQYDRLHSVAQAATSVAIGSASAVNLDGVLDVSHDAPSMAGIYSSSGFDVVGLLSRVVSRKNPGVHIGPVDLSCSFVVCDARQMDIPIVYCSETFELLTGYSRSEIVGRNCRFLQAPDGHVSEGEVRKYSDNNAIRKVKRDLLACRETQTPLLNYKKGGIPFVNLLTVVPITWDSKDIAFFVGFQVDLSEQPQAILKASKDGSYAMNYRRTHPPPPLFQPTLQLTSNKEDEAEIISTIVTPQTGAPWNNSSSEILGALGSSDKEVTDRLLSKALLANSEDLIYIISLRGQFNYCSPSSRQVLEYEPEELCGMQLASICHPSDVVNMSRDIKEAASKNSEINTIFRIRRKNSGYLWLESYGRHINEVGKNRKCIVLIGRERPSYYLDESSLLLTGNLTESEVWVKVSPTGIVLFVSSNAYRLLGYSADDLFGKTIQSLSSSPTEKHVISQTISSVAESNFDIKSVRHGLRDSRGVFHNAFTTFFSGVLKSLPSSTSMTTRPMSPPTLSQKRKRPHFLIARIRIDNAAQSVSVSVDENVKFDQSLQSNIFRELDPARATSWQFELHQIQVENKRLRLECAELLQATE